MRYSILIILGLVLCIGSLGCGTGHCIKVGGTYKDFGGSLEYCFDKAKSQEAGAPAFTGDKSGTVFGIDKDTIDKIKDALKDKLGIGAKALSSAPGRKHPVRELFEIIAALQASKNLGEK